MCVCVCECVCVCVCTLMSPSLQDHPPTWGTSLRTALEEGPLDISPRSMAGGPVASERTEESGGDTRHHLKVAPGTASRVLDICI